MELIDKDAIVAEIESYKNSFCDRNGYLEDRETNGLAYDTLCELEDSIDTLEVKGVDLDFILHEYWNLSPKITIDCLESATMTKDEMINFAKHFFELGLKVQKGE